MANEPVILVSKSDNKPLLALGVVALGVAGVYAWKSLRKEGAQDIAILSYTNRRTGVTRKPPQILDVEKDDYIDIEYAYSYLGPGGNENLHVAIWKKTTLDAHDEFASHDWPLDIPKTGSRTTYQEVAELQIESFDLTPDMYGLYVKISGLAELFLSNLIRVGVGGGGGGPDGYYRIQDDSSFPSFNGQPNTTLRVNPGAAVNIRFAVQSTVSIDQVMTAECNIYEGSSNPLGGVGMLLNTLRKTVTLKASATTYIDFTDIAVVGSIDRRDVELKIINDNITGSPIVVENTFDDGYGVNQDGGGETIGFDLGQPTVDGVPQPHLLMGKPVEIVCPVISRSTSPQTIVVKVRISEGSYLFPTPGDMIWEGSFAPYTIQPGETTPFTLSYTPAGIPGNKDLEVWVYINGIEKKYNHFDEAFFIDESVTISFSVKLGGNWSGMLSPAPVSWALQYFDPATNSWKDFGWRLPNEAQLISDVQPGGYIAVLLYNGQIDSGWKYSTAFNPANGSTWYFDPNRAGQPGDLWYENPNAY